MAIANPEPAKLRREGSSSFATKEETEDTLSKARRVLRKSLPLALVHRDEEFTMRKTYIVSNINVTDLDGYERYLNAAIEVTRENGGRVLVGGSPIEIIEGKLHNRIVVIEFESIEAARSAAAGYTVLRDTRGTSAPDYNSVIVEGI